MMAKFCGNCGKPLGENDKVCGNCGTPVAINEPIPPTAQNRAVSNAANGKKAALIGAALLAVIVLAVVLIKAASGTTPKPSPSPTSSVPSSNVAQQIAANLSTPDGEPTSIPAAKKETLEERARKAIKELDVWDGSVAESFDGGDGSIDNPYQIANGAQLAKLAKDTNSGNDFSGKYFVLTCDIMLNDISEWEFKKTPETNFKDASDTSPIWNNIWESIGERSYSWDQDGNIEGGSVNVPFAGNFDGCEYTVWGMFCPMGSPGLFGFITGNVMNTNVACGSIWNYSASAGAIAAWIKNSIITNCHIECFFIQSSTGEIAIQELVGGVCGLSEGNCNISDCSAINVGITVTSAQRSEIGGIIGATYSDKLNISDCYSECYIKICGIQSPINSFGTYNRVGGICGIGYNISNCVSNTNILFDEIINEEHKFTQSVGGGVAGACSGNLTNCVSRGDIIGICGADDYISFAGIAANVARERGNAEDIHISDCYACGDIILENNEKSQNVEINGLFCNVFTDNDDEMSASITNSYFVSDGSDIAIGNYSDNIVMFMDHVEGVPDVKMLKDPSSFANWDFENVWIIDKKINDGLPIPRSLLEIATKEYLKGMTKEEKAKCYQELLSNRKQGNESSKETKKDISRHSPTNYPTAAPNITESPTEDPNSTSEPIPTPKKTQNGKHSTVTDYLLDPDVAQSINDKIESLNDDGMELSVSGETTKLIYTFQFKDTEYSEELEEALKESLNNDENVKTFCGIAKSLESVIDQKNLCVVVTYVDMNGKLIYSREFFGT